MKLKDIDRISVWDEYHCNCGFWWDWLHSNGEVKMLEPVCRPEMGWELLWEADGGCPSAFYST